MKTTLSTFAVLALLFAPGLSRAQAAGCGAGTCPTQPQTATCPQSQQNASCAKNADCANCPKAKDCPKAGDCANCPKAKDCPKAGDCANCPQTKDCPQQAARRQHRGSHAWRAARSRFSRRGVVFPAAPTEHRRPCVSGACPA